MSRSITAVVSLTTTMFLASIGHADTITVSPFAGPNDLNLTGSFFLAANVGSTTPAGDLTVGSANFLSLSNAYNATGGLATLTGAWADLDPFAVQLRYIPGARLPIMPTSAQSCTAWTTHQVLR